MKILDELHAYQGQLSFDELNENVDQIILCSNLSISGYRTKRVGRLCSLQNKEDLAS